MINCVLNVATVELGQISNLNQNKQCALRPAKSFVRSTPADGGQKMQFKSCTSNPDLFKSCCESAPDFVVRWEAFDIFLDS